jgi:predicted dehydrogenase
MPPSDPIRVAIVGLGVWGKIQMREPVPTSPFIKLVAAYDLNPELLAEFCESQGVRALPDFDAILTDDEIEAVLLFTPNAAHPWQAQKLAEAGKHAYLTKPIANYAKEAADMIQAAENAGTVLFVDHGSSVSPAMKAIKRSLEEGLVGDVLMAQVNSSVGVHWQIDETSWRFHRESCPGGSAIQVGVYQSGMLYYLFGKPLRVTGTAGYGPTPATSESSLVLTIDYESGCRSTFLSSYSTKVNTRYLHLFGIEGNIFQGPQYIDNSVKYIREDEWVLKELPIVDADSMLDPKEQFYRQIRHNEAPDFTTDLALHAVSVVDAGLRAAARGQVVEIAEVLEHLP